MNNETTINRNSLDGFKLYYELLLERSARFPRIDSNNWVDWFAWWAYRALVLLVENLRPLWPRK